MGYYTEYKLDVYCDGEQVNYNTVERALGWTTHCDVGDYLKDAMAGDLKSKWYLSDDDMKEVSLALPGFVFCLQGEGEDEDDKWRMVWKNGKKVGGFAKIVWPEWEDLIEDLLKEGE